MKNLQGCDGILYAVGELAVPFEDVSAAEGIRHTVAMIDEAPGVSADTIFTVDQDFQGMSERIFDCLKLQNQKGSAWKAEVYQVKGIQMHLK